jgi:hypothetical protein
VTRGKRTFFKIMEISFFQPPYWCTTWWSFDAMYLLKLIAMTGHQFVRLNGHNKTSHHEKNNDLLICSDMWLSAESSPVSIQWINVPSGPCSTQRRQYCNWAELQPELHQGRAQHYVISLIDIKWQLFFHGDQAVEMDRYTKQFISFWPQAIKLSNLMVTWCRLKIGRKKVEGWRN